MHLLLLFMQDFINSTIWEKQFDGILYQNLIIKLYKIKYQFILCENQEKYYHFSN